MSFPDFQTLLELLCKAIPDFIGVARRLYHEREDPFYVKFNAALTLLICCPIQESTSAMRSLIGIANLLEDLICDSVRVPSRLSIEPFSILRGLG